MNPTVAEPLWLLLIALAIPLGILTWRWNTTMSRVRRALAITLRTALLALVALLLADLSGERTSKTITVVGVIDTSESVRTFAPISPSIGGEPAERFALSFLEQTLPERSADDRIALVAFDGRATTIASATRGDPTSRSINLEPTEGSDIAAALRHAAGIIPPDANGRIVLFTDGNSTGEDPADAARALANRSADPVRIDVVPIEYRVQREVAVETLDAPPTADPQAPVTLRVRLRATQPTVGRLTITRNGVALDINGEDRPGTDRVLSLAGGPHVEFVRVELPDSRVHRFVAEFTPFNDQSDQSTDTITRNNQAEAFSLSPGEGRVLIVDGVAAARSNSPARRFAEIIQGEDLGVDVVPPTGFPQTLVELQAYDAIVLLNVPADDMPSDAQARLASHIKDVGAGLLMVGGPDTFGAGAWRGSLIEPLLPVRLDLPDRLIEPEAAIVLVLDNSGSMGRSVLGSSRSQQEIANESAAAAIRTLDPNDLIGVIAFNSTTDVVHPLATNDDADTLIAKVLAISSGGGTSLPPALRLARDQLAGAKAKTKHVIVLSDGRSTGAESLPQIAAEMSELGIQVSTISVGDQADDATLEQVAAAGLGAYYSVVNPNVLPRIFLKAIRVIRSPMVREQPHGVVVLPSGSTFTAGLSTPPDITGVVLTQPRDEPGVINALATDRGDPLLSHWLVELGNVAAFTSDTHDWTLSWDAWPSRDSFWRRLVRGLLRSAGDAPGELEVTAGNEQITLRYTAIDDNARPIDLLTVPATLSNPDGTTRDVMLDQVGPGEYEATIPVTAPGAYVALAKPMLATRRYAPSLAGAVIDSGSEFRSLQSDTAAISRIAEAGNGAVLDPMDPVSAGLFDRAGITERTSLRSFATALLPWTLALFMLDLANRRLAWDRFAITPTSNPTTSAAPATLGGIRSKIRDLQSAQPDAAFNDADAAELRKKSRQQRMQTPTAQKRGDAQSDGKSSTDPGNSSPRRNEMSSLLAAKKRARRDLDDPA